jgi:hypothetical protein
MAHLGLFHDDAVYWANAKSLADGNGFRIASLPSNPHQTKYPPLYPGFLSLIWRLDGSFPGNLRWAMLATWLMVPPFFFLCRRLLETLGAGPRAALLMTAFFMAQPMFTVLATTMMSEVPFCLPLFGCLILLARPDPRTATVAGLLAGLAYLVRTGALPLVVTVPVLLAFRKQRREAVGFLCGMLPFVAGWMIWVAFHRDPGTDIVTLYYTNYLGYHLAMIPLGLVPELIWKNTAAYLGGVGQLTFFLLDDSYFTVLLARCIGVVAVIGTIRAARRLANGHYLAYAAGLTAILIPWHYPPNQRFVFPLYPLLLFGLVSELRSFAGVVRQTYEKAKGAERVFAAGFGAVTACCIAAGLFLNVNGLVTFLPAFYQEQRANLAVREQTYRWVRANADQDATFSAYDDILLHLFTGRRSVGPPVPPAVVYRDRPEDYAKLVAGFPRFVADYGLDYVLLTEFDWRRDLHQQRSRFRAAIDGSPGFERLEQQAMFQVYRRVRNGSATRVGGRIR